MPHEILIKDESGWMGSEFLGPAGGKDHPHAQKYNFAALLLPSGLSWVSRDGKMFGIPGFSANFPKFPGKLAF